MRKYIIIAAMALAAFAGPSYALDTSEQSPPCKQLIAQFQQAKDAFKNARLNGSSEGYVEASRLLSSYYSNLESTINTDEKTSKKVIKCLLVQLFHDNL